MTVAGNLVGYGIFALGVLVIVVVMTAIGAWWLRWSGRRYLGWVPPERENPRRQGSDKARK